MGLIPTRGGAKRAAELAQQEQLHNRKVAEDPNDVRAWFQLGLIAMEQTQHALAIERLTRAVAIDPNQEQCYHKLGIAHEALGQLGQALACFRRSAELQPDSVDAQHNLGLVCARLGRAGEAVAYFTTALRLKPDFHLAHSHLGNVLAEQGKLAEAVGQYRQALALESRDADTHRNLGVALRRLGQIDEALASLRQAVAVRPDFVLGWITLADTFVSPLTTHHSPLTGDHSPLTEAEAAYRQALKLDPRQVTAISKLGELLTRMKKLDDAIAVLFEGTLHRPDEASIFEMLGRMLAQKGRPESAEAAGQQAVRLQPGYAEAHNSLGYARSLLGKHEEACASYREAVRLKPDLASARGNVGGVLVQLGQLEAAEAELREGLRQAPDDVEIRRNLAMLYRRLGRNEEAEGEYERMLQQRPNDAETICGLGAARNQMGNVEGALACFEQAIALRPQNAEFQTNRALMLLLLEDWANGLDAYDWRLKRKGIAPRLAPQPVWDGTPMPGGTIVVYAEQGFGDTFMCVRFLRLVKERVGKVLFECPVGLHAVLAGCAGIDAFVDPTGPTPAADVQIPLMSLLRVFGTRLDTIPAEAPYLYADPARCERWRKELDGDGVKVGIVWQGNVNHPGDAFRSVKLEQFAALATVPGVQLYSLQKGSGAEQLAGLDGRFKIHDLAGRLGPDFSDTAAAIANLDLVISVDTAVAHLAGALGRDVWALLPFAPDWRWRRTGDKTPWYPTVTLFRQDRSGDWDGVFARVAAALAARVATPQVWKTRIELTETELQALLACSDGELRARLRSALAEHGGMR